MEPDNYAETIADLAQKAGTPRLVSHGGRTFLTVPEGVQVKEVTDPHGLIVQPPIRIATHVTVQTVDSLVAYVDRFSCGTSLLLADISENRIRAQIDYHGLDEPKHLQHSATMDLNHSLEWQAWRRIDGKMMSQLEFARFVEENAADISAPSGADLLEVVRDLQALRKVDFRKAVRTSSDNESFEYAETTETRTSKGAVELPTKFGLYIPVYFGGQYVSLYAMLRWRLDEGTLYLGIALHRAEAVRQAEFQRIVQDIAERTGLLAVYGHVNGAS